MSGTPEKVLFLDIDGVLNGMNDGLGAFSLHLDRVARLLEIEVKTDCTIILSSTWRKFDDHKHCLNRHGIFWADETIVVWSMTRGEEIREWLVRNPDVTNYVILDDDPSILFEDQAHWVHVDQEEGLTQEAADRVLELFNTGV